MQTNRLMKRMDVKQIAVSNIIGPTVSGALGVWLAVEGKAVGAGVAVGGSRCCQVGMALDQWGWLPTAGFHLDSLKKYGG